MEIQTLLARYCRRAYFRQNPQPVRIGEYRPSVLCWSCVRRQWNYYKQFANRPPEEIPDNIVLLLAGGIVFHRLVQNIRKDDNTRYWDRVEVECQERIVLPNGDSFIIKGHADAIRNGVVYEFKHTRSIPTSPKFEHRLQINFYLKALSMVEGKLCYVGYDPDGGLSVREFPVFYSDWHFNHLVTRAQTLHYLLLSDMPPRCSCRNNIHEYQII